MIFLIFITALLMQVSPAIGGPAALSAQRLREQAVEEKQYETFYGEWRDVGYLTKRVLKDKEWNYIVVHAYQRNKYYASPDNIVGVEEYSEYVRQANQEEIKVWEQRHSAETILFAAGIIVIIVLSAYVAYNFFKG